MTSSAGLIGQTLHTSSLAEIFIDKLSTFVFSMYEYLIGILVLACIWVSAFVLRKDLRKPVVWSGVAYIALAPSCSHEQTTTTQKSAPDMTDY